MKRFKFKLKFRQASNCCKRVLEAAELLIVFSTKLKSAIPPLFNGPEVLSSASNKVKILAKKFFKNSNLDGSSISLPIFPSRTNQKLHNISITPKMFKKV